MGEFYLNQWANRSYEAQ